MSGAHWKIMAVAVTLSASILGSGCGDSCEVDGDCEAVECRNVEFRACLDRNRGYKSVWPLGQDRPGSCATEDDCDLLETLPGGTGTGVGTSTGTGAGAGGSP